MMRRGLPTLAAALLLVAVVSPAPAQRFADVEMKATHVAGAVHMLEGAGGHIGVSVGEDGILIVDDQFAELADRIRAALGKLGEGKLRFVLNTHYHGDHVGANPVFGPEATIIAHDNVRERLLVPQRGQLMDPKGLPVITYDDSVSVHFNGEEIRLLHVPRGHTDGDTIVFFTGSNVVHMGDQMFAGIFPFVDIDGGGSVEGYRKNIARVLSMLDDMPGVKVIPGHGPLATPADLKALHDMIAETRDVVEKHMKSGKSLEEIVEAGLPEQYDSWSWQFIDTKRWIETLHRDLSGE